MNESSHYSTLVVVYTLTVVFYPQELSRAKEIHVVDWSEVMDDVAIPASVESPLE